MKNLVFALVLGFSFASMAEVKVGLVNIQKIMLTIKEGKSVNKTLEKSFKAKQKLLKKQEKTIMDLQQKLQKQDAVLSDSVKNKKRAEIGKLMEGARRQAAQYEKEIRKQEAELKKPLLEKLKPVIDTVSKTAKVDLTFELTSSPVVYAANKVELTEKVIKAYDKKYSK